MWKNAGCPRQGPLSDMKNRAKARFKGAMRFIRNNEDALRKESLLCKNDKAFWKLIKLMNNSKLSVPNVIDGVTGLHNVVNMWKSHYEELFNCLIIIIFWYTTRKMYFGKISCPKRFLLLKWCVKQEFFLLIFFVFTWIISVTN